VPVEDGVHRVAVDLFAGGDQADPGAAVRDLDGRGRALGIGLRVEEDDPRAAGLQLRQDEREMVVPPVCDYEDQRERGTRSMVASF
jgi:hypothetical protein